MATSVPHDGAGSDSGAERRPLEEATASTTSNTSDFGQDLMSSIDSISQPVEMSDLSQNTPRDPTTADPSIHASHDIAEQSVAHPPTTTTVPEASPSEPPLIQSVAPTSESGIGPATDRPAPHTTSASGPQLVITLLLHSTDTRHPYTIDESYLKRRNVSVENNNPINMTVYTLKELILRDWRQEWEAKPTSPTSIRLIHMGRMLDDKAYLKDSRFSNGDIPHIVHMTIKPQEAIDEEDARIAKGGGRDRDGDEVTRGCRCVIM